MTGTLTLATTDSSAVGDGTVVVTVRCGAPDVVRAAVREDAAGDLGGWASLAFEVGARALEHARGDAGVITLGAGADAAASRVADAAEQARRRVSEAVLAVAADDGDLARGVTAVLDGLRGDVAALLADAGVAMSRTAVADLARASESATATVQRLLVGHSDALRLLASPDHPAFAGLTEQVRVAQEETRRVVADLAARFEARDAAERVGRGTATKGAATEASVVEVLSDVAIGHEDVPEATGTTVGLVDGRRVGDWVSTLAERSSRGRTVRVVAEVKDGRITLPALRRELALALENRGAAAGLGVVRTDDGLPGGRRVVVLGDRLIAVAWNPEDPPDLLAACYAVCRLVAVTHVLAEGADTDGLLPGLRLHVAAALEALGGLDALDRAAGQAARHLAEVRAVSERVRQAVSAQLARATNLLEAA